MPKTQRNQRIQRTQTNASLWRIVAITIAAGLTVWVATMALEKVLVPGWREQLNLINMLGAATLLLAVCRLALSKAPKAVFQLVPPFIGLLGVFTYTINLLASPSSHPLDQFRALIPQFIDAIHTGVAPLAITPPIGIAMVFLCLTMVVMTDALAHSRFPMLSLIGPIWFWIPVIWLGIGVPRLTLVVTVAALILIITLTNPTKIRGNSVKLAWKPILLGVIASAVAIAPSIGASYAAGPDSSLAPRRHFRSNATYGIGGIGSIGLGDFGQTLRTDLPLAGGSDDPLFTYVTASGQNVSLLRFATFSEFDGQEWTAFRPAFGGARSVQIIQDGGGDVWPGLDLEALAGGDWEAVSQYPAAWQPYSPDEVVIFRIDNLVGNTLPLLGQERQITVSPTGHLNFNAENYGLQFGSETGNYGALWNFDGANDVAVTLEPLTPGTQIKLGLTRGAFDAETLRAALPYPPSQGVYLGVLAPGTVVRPEHLIVKNDEAVLTERARKLTADAPTYYDAVIALQNYLSNSGGFTYSNEAPAGDNANMVLNFLEQRHGYCVHFATTMVLLSRAIGLPARVAVGFSTTNQNDTGQWVVTSNNAHSWAEIYFGPHVGWVPFDPTPTAGTTPSYLNRRPSDWIEYEDALMLEDWDPTAIHGGGNRDDELPLAITGENNTFHLGSTDLVLLLSVIFAFVLVAAGFVILAYRTRHRSLRNLKGKVSAEDFALAQMVDSLHHRGISINAGCTPRQIPHAAASGWQAKYHSAPPINLVVNLQRISGAAEQVRYLDSSNTLTNPEIKTIIKQIKKAKPVRAK